MYNVSRVEYNINFANKMLLSETKTKNIKKNTETKNCFIID